MSINKESNTITLKFLPFKYFECRNLEDSFLNLNSHSTEFGRRHQSIQFKLIEISIYYFSFVVVNEVEKIKENFSLTLFLY